MHLFFQENVFSLKSFFFFFLMWAIFKVFIELVTTLLLFLSVLVFFGHQAFEILAPPPGIKPTPHALEDKALTTGPRGKPLKKIS